MSDAKGAFLIACSTMASLVTFYLALKICDETGISMVPTVAISVLACTYTFVMLVGLVLREAGK